MKQSSFPRWLAAALVAVLLIIVVGGSWLYRTQAQQMRNREEENLMGIAQLKVDQLVAWRTERLGDAGVLTENAFFADGAAQWLADPQSESLDAILNQFQSLQDHYHYSDILLVDSDGQVRLSLSGWNAPLHQEAASVLAAAWRDRQPMLTDLHAGPGDLPPHIDVIAPLFASNDLDGAIIGAVILQSDAQQYLYPRIQSWPVPSRSAETLLVRRDGDAALFLNDLRYQPDAALKLRIPLSQTDVPAVMAIQGRGGIVRGRDYRGVQVEAAILAVPDTTWFMIAKVDTSEIFADWRARATLILALIPALVAVVGASGGIVWQRTQKVQYRHLFHAEKARQASEARYQTTLMSIGDGVIVTNTTGQVTLLNPVAEALTGWTQEEAFEKPLEEVFLIINEDTRQSVSDPVSQVLRKGTVVGLANHTLLLSKSGQEIPIADSAAPVQDDKGNLIGVVLVFRDQTDERAARQALRESETYIRTVLDNLPVGVAVNSVDPKVTFSYVNDNFVKCYRTTREALAGPDAFWEAVYEDTEFREIIKQRVLEDVASGDPERMHWDDVPLTRQGAETTYISAMNVPIHGTQLMLSIVWDTTKRKQAEDEIRHLNADLEQRVNDRTAQLIQAKERIEAILNSSSDIIVLCGSDGTIDQVNPAFDTAFHIEPDAFLGERLSALVAPQDVTLIEQTVAEVIETGQSGRIELTAQVAGAVPFEADAVLSPLIQQADQVTGIVCTLRDITDRKRIEAQLRDLLQHAMEMNEMKTRFVSMASHQFRTPLAVIRSAADLLNQYGERLSNEEKMQRFAHIQRQVDQMVELLDAVLMIGRAESGLLDFKPEQVDVIALCQTLVTDFEEAIGQSHALRFTHSGDCSTTTADPRLLRNILDNLLSNAIKYSPQGSTVTLDLTCGADTTVLNVMDQGIGIRPKDQKHLFEAFYRAANTGSVPGTGLGLAIVKQLVTLHGGTITFTSQEGHGTTFSIRIPQTPPGR